MLLFTFAVISILFSFLCSVWEAVLLSIPSAFVEIKITEKDPTGNKLKKLKDDIDEPLSAILSLNTIAHTIGAIGVGAQAEETFGSGHVIWFGQEMPFSAEAVVAVVMTLAILILSEIIPKTLGATYWKRLAGFTANSLELIMVIMRPLVRLSQFITKKIKGNHKHEVVSRADLSAMAQIGQRDGVFHPGESLIISNLMRFNELEANSIMTPRTVVRSAKESKTIQEFYDENQTLPFSRIPVFESSKDNVTGFVLKDVVLDHLVKGKGNMTLSEIKRPISIVKRDQDIQSVFNQLLSKREHIALVVDEYGGTAGIVTLEDVIETMIGLEIVDELDNTGDMQKLARQNWEKRAKKLGLIED